MTMRLKAARVLHEKGIGIVMITLGSRGVWVSHDGQAVGFPVLKFRPSIPLPLAIAPMARFVTALLEGTALDEAIRFAHAAAACVTRKGAAFRTMARRNRRVFTSTGVTFGYHGM